MAFAAALRRLDARVAITVVERELVGGECSHWACMPSKALLRPFSERGIEVDDRLRAADGVWACGDVTGIAMLTHVG